MLKKYQEMSMVAKCSFWALVSSLIQKGVGVVMTPLFTRLLTTDEFAQYSLFLSWHNIFIILTTLNVFAYSTYTAMAKFEEDRDGFLASALMLCTIGPMIGLVIYTIFFICTNKSIRFPYSVVVFMFIDIMFISVFTLWAQKERYGFKYQLLTILSITIGIMGPLTGIVLILLGRNPKYARIFGVVIVDIVIGIIAYTIIICKSRDFFNKRYWKYMFCFGIPVVPHLLASQILTGFDKIMLGKLCDDTTVAIYSLAYSVSLLMNVINDAVLKSLTPWTYKAIKANNLSIIQKPINMILVLVATANFMLMLFAPEMIYIFAPKDYYSAIYIIPSVSASVYFTFLFNIFANIEYYFSETKYIAFASVVAAVLNIILNYFFIPIGGAIAAGYTTLICYIIYAIGHYYFMRKVCKKYLQSYDVYEKKIILFVSILVVIFSLISTYLYTVNWIIRWIFIVISAFFIFIKRKVILEIIKKK